MTKTKVLMVSGIALALAGCNDVRSGWYYLTGQQEQTAAPAQYVPPAPTPYAQGVQPAAAAVATPVAVQPPVVESTAPAQQSDEPAPKPLATQPDIVSIKLAQAANKAAEALDRIAAIEQHRNPAVPQAQKDFGNASGAIMQPVSLRWSGPIDQAARVLAERAGLHFRVSGRAPAAPLVVNIDAYQQPILYVLRNIGLQAGSRADLLVNQNQGVVEVRYAAADQSR
ncbi:MAG: DotD/TraH family lipoprotein [Alphaproteobacteria bacterium]|nr:DotD/TraH family lipoprotein [Alphaproteobacteria bacterium]